MKGRPTVDWRRYGGREIWVLFPDPVGAKPGRPWFFIKHHELFAWVKNRHGAAPGWNGAWSYPRMSVDLRKFLQASVLDAARPEDAAT
jgi:hypothetical protein